MSTAHSRSSSDLRRVAVLGAGFGALSTVRELRRRDPALSITVVAPRAELHYLPGSIWIPSGLRQREDLVVPLEGFFRRMKVDFLKAEVTGLQQEGRRVFTSAGELTHDAVVIASGGRFLHSLPGSEYAIVPCEGIAAAERLRDRLHALQEGTIAVGFSGNPKEPVAVRGGPMFEFLFGLDTQLRRERRRDRFELVFFNPAQEPGNRLGPRAVQHLLQDMRRRGIRTHLGHKITRFEPQQVVTEGGSFQADLILYMPGMTGNAWFDATTLPRSPGGLVRADAQCRVPGWDRTYVVGDSGSFPGPDWMPKQAHMADLQAAAAAENLIADLQDRPSEATFKVELLCIVDAGDRGTLIWRTLDRHLMLRDSRLLHWAKRGFERRYLRQYR